MANEAINRVEATKPTVTKVEGVIRKPIEIDRSPVSLNFAKIELNDAFIALLQNLRMLPAGKLDPKQIKIDPTRASWLVFDVQGGKKLT